MTHKLHAAHRRGLFSLAACLLLVGLFGCGRTINRTAERKIRDALPTYIGPARMWRAHVESAPENTLRGRLGRVTIDGEQVRLRQAVLCDTLHIEMHDTLVDTQRQRLRSVGRTTFRTTVGQEALTDYLRRFPPPDDEPVRIQRVYLRPGVIHAEATRWALRRAWPFTIDAEPRLASPSRLEFDPDRMTVVGLPVPLPRAALRFLARHLSDGFDFSTLPFPLRIARFRVAQGQIEVEGMADVMDSLNERIGREWPAGDALAHEEPGDAAGEPLTGRHRQGADAL